MELAGPAHASPSLSALAELALARYEREEFSAAAEVLPMYLRRSDAELAWDRKGHLMAAEPEIADVEVHLVPMRRRHLRGVVRIEAQVYPRPWSHSLFVSEIALRSSRSYVVAKVGREVVGYAGLMMSLTDGHVTTIAVDPAWHRYRIGTRLLLTLAYEAIERGRARDDARSAAVEPRRAGDVQAVRVHRGRRAQGLLRRHR